MCIPAKACKLLIVTHYKCTIIACVYLLRLVNCNLLHTISVALLHFIYLLWFVSFWCLKTRMRHQRQICLVQNFCVISSVQCHHKHCSPIHPGVIFLVSSPKFDAIKNISVQSPNNAKVMG